MTTKFSVLGRGVYELSEAARYTGLHPNRVCSWFRPRVKMIGEPIFASDYVGLGAPKALSFLNLVEVLVVGQFREKGVSLQEVRRAYVLLRKDLKTDHPFSHQCLYAHSGKIFAKVAEETGSDALYEVVKRQGFSEEVMKGHLEQIDYNSLSRQAERWRIAQGVVLDPDISFGKPTIEGRGTTTLVLAKAYWANDNDASFVASLFEVTKSEVRNAVSFEERIRSRKVA